MLLRSLIVEDEPENAEGLKTVLAKYCPEVQVVAVAEDVDSAVSGILEHHPDLVFLDIRLSGEELAGFRVLEQTAMLDYEVVFTTAFENYWRKANDLKRQVAHYLVKPFRFEEVAVAVSKAAESRRLKIAAAGAGEPSATGLRRERLALSVQEGLILVWVKDIVRCEASGSYTQIWLLGASKPRLVSRNLGWFVQQLPPEKFVRVHHSHLVNFDFVEAYMHKEGGVLVLADKAFVPVGGSYKLAVLARLNGG